ncbi:uncharacterized protein LOC131216017 [Anopheles bellator]|uniref:uncharacterized protein LOC131216017 n=1 Tax=Anopheles bellator TaxID=139047 RepID=UPI002647480A|nr:uncharacterized protein LOC131216017 [Anopheles bellator]
MDRRRYGAALATAFGFGLLVVLVHPDRVAADLMGDIQQGLQTTGKLFGINTIADVADLVAKGFATRRGTTSEAQAAPAPTTDEGGTGGILSTQTPSMMMVMMRLFGLDGGQLGAMLVNGIIFLAHVIGTNLGAFRKPTPLDPGMSTFLRDPPHARHPPEASPDAVPESNSSGNPLEWMLRNPSKRFRVLLDQVENSDLTEYLERELDHLDQYPPEDTDCIRLLMCKIKPFVRKMQHVVRDQITQPPPTGAEDGDETASDPQADQPPDGPEMLKGIYRNLPTSDEFRAQSKLCERQFTRCSREFGPGRASF